MSGPQSELDTSRALLCEMGFELVPTTLPEILERAVKEKLSMPAFLDLVMKNERDFREERRVRAMLKISGLPAGKTMESYDFTFHRGADREKMALLGTCEFARRRENVLLLGPPGVARVEREVGAEFPEFRAAFRIGRRADDERRGAANLFHML